MINILMTHTSTMGQEIKILYFVKNIKKNLSINPVAQVCQQKFCNVSMKKSILI